MAFSCCTGNRAPSPLTMRRTVSWVTAVTWTGAGASASFVAGWEHDMASRQAAIKGKAVERVVFRILEHPRESLKIRQSQTVADHAVQVGVSRLHQGALRIRHFQDGGFAGLIAQQREPETLRGEIGAVLQGGHLGGGNLRLLIELVQLGQQLALREA